MDANDDTRDGAVSVVLVRLKSRKLSSRTTGERAYQLPVPGTHSVCLLTAFGLSQALRFSDVGFYLSIVWIGLIQITK